MSSSQLVSQSACAHKLRILADSTRLAVLQMLMEQPLHVQDMNAVLGLEQSLLSHHLKVLRQEGFVTAIRDGKAVLYHLAASVQPAQADRAVDLGCCLLTFE
jgi:ArsR family transcriptional regulator